MSKDATVYSTGEGRVCPVCGKPVAGCLCGKAKAAPAGDGVVRVRRELKGRRGKTVTRVSGLPLGGAELKELASRLKQRCGTGGGMDGADLIIQGDQVEKILAVLAEEGYRAKKAGG
jgi:translation initiation factor 1